MALVSSSHRRLSGAPTPQQQQGQGGRGRRLFYSPLSNQQHHQQHQHFYLMNSKTNNLSSESVDDWNQQFDAFHDNFHEYRQVPHSSSSDTLVSRAETFEIDKDNDEDEGEEGHHGHGKGASVNEALYNIVCVIAGSGVLQLPLALSQAGWIGVPLIILAALVNTYTGNIIIKCLKVNENSYGPRLKSFTQIGQAAYGSKGKVIVDFFCSIMQLGVTCVYLILAGMNLADLFGWTTRAWISICALLVLIPFLAFRTLKEVALLSAFGVFATILVIASVLIFAIQDIPSNASTVSHKIADLSKIPAALGSICFSFSGNFVYPSVQASMAQPELFPRVLSWSMGLITGMYLLTAVFGYWAYGDTTVSPILNNLPKGIVAKFSIFVITAHVLLAIPILLTSFAIEIERRYKLNSHPRQSVIRPTYRVMLVLILSLIAMLIPYFADCMSLLGAVASTFLMFIFPIVFDWKLFGMLDPPSSLLASASSAAAAVVAGNGLTMATRRRRSRLDFWAGVGVLVLGVYVGVLGGGQALLSLYNDVMNGDTSGRGGHK